jgi:hypothetical protein
VKISGEPQAREEGISAERFNNNFNIEERTNNA